MPPPKDISHLKETLRQALPLLAARYDVHALGLFGSYVRHQQREGSDLDVLVEFRKTPGLLKFIELEDYLSDFLGVKKDVSGFE